jgi:cystathionine gamma-synthase
MRQACDNADQLAAFLHGHRQVSRVYFPGLPDSRGRDVVVRQMTRAGAMLSFETVGGREFAADVPKCTKLFRNATSLGGTESLIEHRISSEGPDSTTPETLIRVSTGIEHAQDLIEDLDRALSQAGG